MSPASSGSEPWMPNGFPPPSFVVDTERTSTFAGARGRWLAAAAILGALLLIAGVLLLAGQGDEDTALTAGTTTTAFAGTTPTTPTTELSPTAGLPAATTTEPGGGTPADSQTTTTKEGPGTPSTTAAPPPAGVLAVASSVSIPKVVGNAPSSAQVALKNNGNASLSFNSKTNFSGLTVAPATGTIGAGAEVVVTITLNGAAAAEGPFTGLVNFGGSGGTQQVTVSSTVVRPPIIAENAQAVQQCPTEGPNIPCSKLIDTLNEDPKANPCNSDWVFKVNVSDDSGVSRVKALGPEVALKMVSGEPKSAVWQSDPQRAIPPGVTYKFTIEAVDTFDNAARTTERTITCPASAPGA